jgi:DNA-binding IclR family transcriptional regulator
VSTAPGVDGQGSKTLDRGVRVLEALAERQDGMTVGELADHLGTHRAAIYRLVRTLAQHRLVRKGPAGRYGLGIGLVALARRAVGDVREVAMPELMLIAEELGATAYLTVAEADEAVVVATAEPQQSHMHVTYRVGFRHPITRGASGLAILSARPPQDGERPEVEEARRRGYATSVGELQRGAHAVAVAIPAGRTEACLGVVALADLDVERVATRLKEAAETISGSLA